MSILFDVQLQQTQEGKLCGNKQGLECRIPSCDYITTKREEVIKGGERIHHACFSPTILHQEHPICHLEALNVVVGMKLWAPLLADKLIHVYSDNATAVAIFQAGGGRDDFIQVCASDV